MPFKFRFIAAVAATAVGIIADDVKATVAGAAKASRNRNGEQPVIYISCARTDLRHAFPRAVRKLSRNNRKVGVVFLKHPMGEELWEDFRTCLGKAAEAFGKESCVEESPLLFIEDTSGYGAALVDISGLVAMEPAVFIAYSDVSSIGKTTKKEILVESIDMKFKYDDNGDIASFSFRGMLSEAEQEDLFRQMTQQQFERELAAVKRALAKCLDAQDDPSLKVQKPYESHIACDKMTLVKAVSGKYGSEVWSLCYEESVVDSRDAANRRADRIRFKETQAGKYRKWLDAHRELRRALDYARIWTGYLNAVAGTAEPIWLDGLLDIDSGEQRKCLERIRESLGIDLAIEGYEEGVPLDMLLSGFSS